jgi:transglutaminase-like putative cysteine protease
VVVSLRYGAEGRTRPMWLRVAIGVAAVTALLLIATEAQGVDGLLRALQGPLPDLLMVLAVIHGFEATDRRTVRVHIAISAVVVAYAAGLRIDERVAWWLAAWGVLCVLATRSTARAIPPSPGARNRRAPDAALRRAGRRRVLRLTASSLVIVAATIALLGLVNVPDGPANLGLPALADDALTVESPGALIGPDGSISRRGDSGDGTRGALGQAGGYPGFSETLDTSIRGDLGDEIVLRVKAPEPAFWRGQTFTEFDGRFWTVSQETGRPSSGPTIDVGPTIGDEGGAPTTEFVQTFYVEADLPNVVFAAPRPSRLMFDGTVHLRPDGALRADATLAEGSVYTVTSRRAEVTANSLRAQGDVGEWFGQFDDPRSSVLLAPYLALPNSTSERTLRLSAQLRADTTFDTVLAYQEWLATNTVYDLHAPIPNEGSDAVDDYLFVTQRGFCEQIASSLVVMLRSQDVPARLATGYLPGERDRVSGVWQVRASDAHAWVEVWFPASGWQPFDPTAEVPLSGTVENSTIGGDLLAAAISSATGHLPELALAGLAMLAGLAALRLTRTVRTRRVRGRWGLLQDRFTELAGDDTGAHPLTNPSIAVQFERPEPRRDGATRAAADATFVATTLDRVRFDPAWIDDEADYALVRGEIERLERSVR